MKNVLLAALASCSALPACAQSPDVVESVPIVLTPTRLRQGLDDVPASVTIITGDMLRRYSILSIPDALRLVPGMAVTQVSGSDFRISYHGTNILVPRRMNVLIDGVSVYQPAVSGVDWGNLPVAMEDIDRIEVTRGPNSAAYGPNSMQAVVSIITKHPDDVDRLLVATTLGTQGLSTTTSRAAALIGSASLRITASHERTAGYDHQTQGVGGDHDSNRMGKLTFQANAPLGLQSRISIGAGLVRGRRDVAFVDTYQQEFPDVEVTGSYWVGTLTHSFSPIHEAQLRIDGWTNQLQQRWKTCPPADMLLRERASTHMSRPSFAHAAAMATGPGTVDPGEPKPTCGLANRDLFERRVEVELQDSAVISDQLRVVAGAGFRVVTGSSTTFFGGTEQNSTRRAFTSIEYRPDTRLTFNGGAYVEADRFSGVSTSPRMALNYKLTERHTIRAVWWSQGLRSPDLQEQAADGSYPLQTAGAARHRDPTYSSTARSAGKLQPEKLRSAELAYMVNLPTKGVLLDVRVFQDDLYDLISEKLQATQYRPTNRGYVRLTGAEIQATGQPSADWQWLAQYSYLQNSRASTQLERTQYSRHSGAVSLWHSFGNGWSGSVGFTGASGDGVGQSGFGRFDLSATKALRLDQAAMDLTILVRRLSNRTQTYFDDSGSVEESRYNRRLQLAAQARITF